MRSRTAQVLAGIAAVATAAGVLGTSRRASAEPVFGPQLGGPVFVGPTGEHVAAIHHNPAALALLEGVRLELHTSARYDWTTIALETTDANGLPTGTRGPEVDASTLSPTGVFAFSWEAAKRAVIGASVAVPLFEAQPDDPAFAAHARGGHLATVVGSIAFALRVTKSLSVGAAAHFSANDTRLRYDVDRGLESCTALPCPMGDPAQIDRVDVDVGIWPPDIIPGVGLGALLRVGNVWIGLSWTIPPGVAGGNVDSEAATTVERGDGSTVVGESRIAFQLPHVIQGGARWMSTYGDLVFNVRLATLGTQQSIDVRHFAPELRSAGVPEWEVRHRGLELTGAFELGWERGESKSFRWGLRARYETSSVDEREVSPAVIDGPEAGLGAGFEWRPGGLVVSAGVGVSWLLGGVDVSDSAYTTNHQLECVGSGYDLDTCQAAHEGRGIRSAAGRYERLSPVLSLGIGYDW